MGAGKFVRVAKGKNQTQSKVARLQKTVARIPRQPRQQYRGSALISVFNPSLTSRTQCIDLFNISVGDQINQRQGNVIHIHSIDFYLIANQRGGNLANAVVKHALLQDVSTEQTPNLSTFANLYETSAFVETGPVGTNAQAAVWYNRELWRKPKFTRTHLLAAGGADGAGQSMVQFKKTIRFKGKGHKVVYRRTASNVYTTGAIYWLINAFSMTPTAQNEDLDIQFNYIINYTSG